MSHSITVKSFPNNEIRVTCQREKGAARFDFNLRDDDGLANAGTERSPTPVPGPLDITSKLSDPLSPGFGGEPRPTKFGNNARRTISRASGVFDRDGHKPEEFVFLTGTIPGSTREAFDAIARYSSWAIKAIKTWLSDKGIASAYSLYVWEFQKRGALHVHYCVHTKNIAQSKWIRDNWHAKWSSIIDTVSEKSGVDCWKINGFRTWANNKKVLQADAQKVHKSVGSYLSKYLSKKAPTITKRRYGSRPFLCPVRWWGCSRPLLKRMRELTEEFKVESISNDRIRYVKNEIEATLRGSENGVHSYWDKARSTHVLLTYSPESWECIYNELWRDHHELRRQLNPGFLALAAEREIPAGIPLSAESKAALYNAGILVLG